MDFKAEVKRKYSYLTDEDAVAIVNRAKWFYYNALYPADLSADETTRPIKGFRQQQWILAACDEIVERNGISSATAYSENGVRMEFDNSQISEGLFSQLKPMIGVVGK